MNARENRQRPLPSSRAQVALKIEAVAKELKAGPSRSRVSELYHLFLTDKSESLMGCVILL